MIKILVVNMQTSGVDMYRLTPHRYLDPERFEVNFTPMLENPTDDLYKKIEEYDIVVFSRMLSKDTEKDWTSDLMTHLNKAKVKVVMDYDDNWQLPKYHTLYKTYEKNGYRLRQVKACRFADAVTVSTPYLRDKLLPYNKDITVVKNCIDHREPQWMRFKTPSDKLRVAFIGGKDHVKDMEYISEEFCKLSDLDVELYYGGFAPGKENQDIAVLMSCRGNNKNFDIIPALTVDSYAQMYNHVDVCIAPLFEDEFTKCKSELKAIEAGFMKCALIASNQIPFTYVCNEENSILVGQDGLYDAVKRLNDNRELVTEYAEKLHKDVIENYDIEEEAKKREELYERLCGKREQ